MYTVFALGVEVVFLALFQPGVGFFSLGGVAVGLLLLHLGGLAGGLPLHHLGGLAGGLLLHYLGGLAEGLPLHYLVLVEARGTASIEEVVVVFVSEITPADPGVGPQVLLVAAHRVALDQDGLEASSNKRGVDLIDKVMILQECVTHVSQQVDHLQMQEEVELKDSKHKHKPKQSKNKTKQNQRDTNLKVQLIEFQGFKPGGLATGALNIENLPFPRGCTHRRRSRGGRPRVYLQPACGGRRGSLERH